MVKADEVGLILIGYLFQAPIPTMLLVLAKATGLLPIPWSWVVLPMASALFFMASFLLAMALIRVAHSAAGRGS